MKRIIIQSIIVLLLAAPSAMAQQRNFRFDFGTKKASPGFIPVQSSNIYSDKTGYGFLSNNNITDVSRGSKKNISSDFTTGTQPFFL